MATPDYALIFQLVKAQEALQQRNDSQSSSESDDDSNAPKKPTTTLRDHCNALKAQRAAACKPHAAERREKHYDKEDVILAANPNARLTRRCL